MNIFSNKSNTPTLTGISLSEEERDGKIPNINQVSTSVISSIPLTDKTSKLYKQFQEFVYSNNLVGISAGFSIGIITAEFVKSFVNNILLLFVGYIYYLVFPKSKTNLPRITLPVIKENVGIFVLNGVYWLAIIVSAFFLLEYIFARTIAGTASAVVGKAKKDFEEKKEIIKKDTEVNPHDSAISQPSSITSVSTKDDENPKPVNEEFDNYYQGLLY